MNNKRLVFLDNSKGFAILCMLFAHTMNVAEHRIGIWISSWFMPIFFIICGIILQKKYVEGATFSDFKRTLMKRAFQLGVPYLVFCSLLTAFYFILSRIANEPFDIIRYILRIVKLDGIDSLWFIPCYFIVEIFMILLIMIRGSIGKSVRLLLAVFGVLCIIFHWSFPFVLEVECYSFVYIGFLLSKIDALYTCPIWLSIIMIIVGVPLALINGAVGLASGEFGYGYLYVINAVLTSVAIMAIFAYFEKKEVRIPFFEIFGKDSIVVLCTNNLLIEIIRLIDYKVTGNFLLNAGIWGSVIFTGILIIIELLIISLSHTKIGVIFGKRTIHQSNHT